MSTTATATYRFLLPRHRRLPHAAVATVAATVALLSTDAAAAHDAAVAGARPRVSPRESRTRQHANHQRLSPDLVDQAHEGPLPKARQDFHVQCCRLIDPDVCTERPGR